MSTTAEKNTIVNSLLEVIKTSVKELETNIGDMKRSDLLRLNGLYYLTGRPWSGFNKEEISDLIENREKLVEEAEKVAMCFAAGVSRPYEGEGKKRIYFDPSQDSTFSAKVHPDSITHPDNIAIGAFKLPDYFIASNRDLSRCMVDAVQCRAETGSQWWARAMYKRKKNRNKRGNTKEYPYRVYGTHLDTVVSVMLALAERQKGICIRFYTLMQYKELRDVLRSIELS